MHSEGPGRGLVPRDVVHSVCTGLRLVPYAIVGFRGRVINPNPNPLPQKRGVIVGFGGRVIDPNPNPLPHERGVIQREGG